MEIKIPRHSQNDYSPEIIAERQRFIESKTGTALKNIKHFSFDPNRTQGNIEHLTGVAQIPLGFAGPLLLNGEFAKGDFYVPMATTEGTLVASYNRGMRLTREVGGVKATVVDDAMQRAPVFGFDDARAAKVFSNWIKGKPRRPLELVGCVISSSMRQLDLFI
jgi:hydroxymethylglutaryl-CoA reductase (NADPH)